jgi:hypothetical protein
MSIAVSVVVKPSRLLLITVGSMCFGIAVAAGMIGFAKVGELSLYPRLAIAGGCFFAGLSGFYWTVQARKTFHIDISGVGQIRLVETSVLAASSRQDEWLNSNNGGAVVRLMSDSTIWPYLLLLRLQDERHRIKVLPILRDCVAADGFRALSVACRWIATQNNQAEGKNV